MLSTLLALKRRVGGSPGKAIRVRRLGLSLLGFVLVGGSVVVLQSPAYADYISCPPDNGPCIIVVTGPGDGGGGGGGGGDGGDGEARCLHEQLGYIDCHRQGDGWFNPEDTCFYQRLNLPIDDPQWDGNDPANGFMYRVTCWGGNSAGWYVDRTEYLTSEPPGYGGLPDPLSLALQAINRLPISGPDIHTAPSESGSGLVGLPVWMWTPETASTWGPASATASVPGLTVTATATATRIAWDMGDGTVVVCTDAGTPYSPSYADSPSPDCGHKYRKPSRNAPGGKYAIEATTTWVVQWAGGGRSGTVSVNRSSTASLLINELQVVVE